MLPKQGYTGQKKEDLLWMRRAAACRLAAPVIKLAFSVRYTVTGELAKALTRLLAQRTPRSLLQTYPSRRNRSWKTL